MIFSNQLGKINTASPQEGIAQVANHIRKMQEELEYRLMNLSSDNISEIDMSQTTILAGDAELQTIIRDNGQKYSEVIQTVDGFRAEVGRYSTSVREYENELAELTGAVAGYDKAVRQYATQVSTFNQDVHGFDLTVQGYEKDVLEYADELRQLTASVRNYDNDVKDYAAQVVTFNQDVEGFRLDVQGYSENALKYANELAGVNLQIQAYEAAVNGYGGEVNNYAAQVSIFNQTVDGFDATVVGYKDTLAGYTAEYSTFNQKADSITGRVADLETGMSTTVRLDAEGFHIMGESGREDVEIGEGLSEEKVETLITGQLVSSPKIMGGEFFDRKGNGRLKLDLGSFDYPLFAYDWGSANSDGDYEMETNLFYVRADKNGNNVILGLGNIELFKVMDGEVYISDDFVAALPSF